MKFELMSAHLSYEIRNQKFWCRAEALETWIWANLLRAFWTQEILMRPEFSSHKIATANLKSLFTQAPEQCQMH